MYIRAELKNQKLEKDLEEYLDKEYEQIASQFEISLNDIKNIIKRCAQKKKDFMINHLEKELVEMRKKSEENLGDEQ